MCIRDRSFLPKVAENVALTSPSLAAVLDAPVYCDESWSDVWIILLKVPDVVEPSYSIYDAKSKRSGTWFNNPVKTSWAPFDPAVFTNVTSVLLIFPAVFTKFTHGSVRAPMIIVASSPVSTFPKDPSDASEVWRPPGLL